MNIYLYPYSRESAKNDVHLDLWHASHAENIACAKAIDAEIDHFSCLCYNLIKISGFVFRILTRLGTAWEINIHHLRQVKGYIFGCFEQLKNVAFIHFYNKISKYHLIQRQVKRPAFFSIQIKIERGF